MLLAFPAPPNDKIWKERYFAALESLGPKKRVLILPPDISRLPSRSGDLTRWAWEFYGPAVKAILPALGTHQPMKEGEKRRMFGDLPGELFRDHLWRTDVRPAGEFDSREMEELSEGILTDPLTVTVNRILLEQEWDLILSLGQVVPHEVTGFSNYSKNTIIGCGGAEVIDATHFLGAVYGMEKIMGRRDTPVRRLLDTAARRFLSHLPILYGMTVMGRDREGQQKLEGFFLGFDDDAFSAAAALSGEKNIHHLPAPLTKVVVFLDPAEYRSTWIGNKGIYRTRTALEDGAELIIIAPGVNRFGEDPRNDELIRRHGYHGTKKILEAVKKCAPLAGSLSTAAHLIHGSTEGRFQVTWGAGGLAEEEIEGAGYRYVSPERLLEQYPVQTLSPGFNTLPHGEEIFFIPNPAQGLWTAPR